jgi:hypothetical protein
MSEEKEIVSKEETFDKLEIRLGRVINVEEAPGVPKKSYMMRVDCERESGALPKWERAPDLIEFPNVLFFRFR